MGHQTLRLEFLCIRHCLKVSGMNADYADKNLRPIYTTIKDMI